jgi:hypothetical protein
MFIKHQLKHVTSVEDLRSRGQFRHTPSFLRLNYSDDLIILEITFISGAPREKRLAVLKALNAGVVDAAEISPDDPLSRSTRRPARISHSAEGWPNAPISQTRIQRLPTLTMMAEESAIPCLVPQSRDRRCHLQRNASSSGSHAWLAAVARIAALDPHTSSCAKVSTADIARELP